MIKKLFIIMAVTALLSVAGCGKVNKLNRYSEAPIAPQISQESSNFLCS